MQRAVMATTIRGMNPLELLPLFTFGTLRRAERNHHYLEGTYERWLPGMVRDYGRIAAWHGWPAIAPKVGEQVAGELFFIRPEVFVETLGRCDILEEIPPGELTGRHYQRAQVVVETAAGNFTAWAYVDPPNATPADPGTAPDRDAGSGELLRS